MLARATTTRRGAGGLSPAARVFTTGAVARVCCVSPRTVKRWIDSGKLKGYRLPGSADRRVDRGELLRFLRAAGMPTEALDPPGRRVLLVGVSAALAAGVAAALPGCRVECADHPLDAGLLLATLRPAAVAVDLSVGRSAAERLAAWAASAAPVVLVALCGDDGAAAPPGFAAAVPASAGAAAVAALLGA